MDLTQQKTKVNEKENRFELAVDDYLAKIDFKRNRKGDIYMIHTEVPSDLEGKGVGHKLVREALDWLKEHHLKMIPLCPFVRAYVLENLDDYKDLIAEGTKL